MRHINWSARPEPARPCSTPFEGIALVLQGGGALGAYQAGVYEALAERDIHPTWISGISIGAINSAIIAGNANGERVARLRSFWESVTEDRGWSAWLDPAWIGDAARSWLNYMASADIVAGGVPGFFAPRLPPPWLLTTGAPGAISWYDTNPLRATLESLVDFDRINARETRFSVGAVNVRTGNFAYFDNADTVIGPEHVMASGALPPSLPAVEIEGQHYWDGGLVSNTPLEWVLSADSQRDLLVFQVDLWSARGELPHDLTEVAMRMKEIQYSSRTRAATDRFREIQMMRGAFSRLYDRLPDGLRNSEVGREMAAMVDPALYNIVQLIYHSPVYERQSKDFEFSRRSMEDHWRAGYHDASGALSHPQVLELPPREESVRVFDFSLPGASDQAIASPAAAPVARARRTRRPASGARSPSGRGKSAR
jgi:NTE family protein